MASRPFKKAGFRQGIYEESATRKETLGTLRILQDGRKFRYAKAGSSALAAGKMAVAAAIATHVKDETCPTTAVGTKVITLTCDSTTYAQDYFKGGLFSITDAAGEGHSYPINGSSAVAASTSITVSLDEGIRVALTTSSEYTLLNSPRMATVESATEESCAVGITPIVVTAAYYYWAQTGGLAIALMAGTPAVGANLTLGDDAGSLLGVSNAATSSSGITLDVLHLQPIVGYVFGTAGVDTEYQPVFLTID